MRAKTRIHCSFDQTEGIAQGRRVANYVFDQAFTPLRRADNGRMWACTSAA